MPTWSACSATMAGRWLPLRRSSASAGLTVSRGLYLTVRRDALIRLCKRPGNAMISQPSCVRSGCSWGQNCKASFTSSLALLTHFTLKEQSTCSATRLELWAATLLWNLSKAAITLTSTRMDSASALPAKCMKSLDLNYTSLRGQNPSGKTRAARLDRLSTQVGDCPLQYLVLRDRE